MAINWGLALGKALESGLNTYERLGEEELRQMQREKLRQEMQEQKALDTKFSETYGRVGQKNDYTEALQTADTGIGSQQAKMLSDQAAGFGPEGEKASAQAAAGALRENVGVKSALPDLAAGEYTNRQAMGDYTKAAAGVSRKGYVEALGLKKEARTADLDDEFDLKRSTLNKDLALARGTWESKGMQGLSELANKNGLKTKFEPGKDGIGKINVLGPNGDVLQTFTSGEDALKALEKAAYGKFQDSAVSLLGGPDKLLTYLNQREEIGIKREQLGIEKEHKGKDGVIDRAYNAKAAGKAPKKEVSNSDIKSFITEFGDRPSNRKDPKTGKAIPINQLPLNEQAAYAYDFYLGRDEVGGGLPDVPKGGLTLEKPGAKAQSQPAPAGAPRKFEGQKFGVLTPRDVVEEAARAGNPDAIRFLEGQERNKLAQEMNYGNNMPL